jgi:hypothetical protein
MGPKGDLEKKMFIRKFKLLKSQSLLKWLILGDFNLIYQGIWIKTMTEWTRE